MKQALGKSALIPLVCCLAFGVSYVSVHRTFGQGEPTAPAMTGRGYLARLTLIVVSIIICGLLTSQGSVADFKGNQVEARKVPWRAGSGHYVSGGCGLGGIFKNICPPA